MAEQDNSYPTQIVISYRETEQTLVTTAQDYLTNCKTKYRNWRLFGRADFVQPLLTACLYTPVEKSAQ